MSETQIAFAKEELARRVEKIEKCKQLLDQYKSNTEPYLYVMPCIPCQTSRSVCNNCSVVVGSRCATDFSLVYNAENEYRGLISTCKTRNLLDKSE